jgi:flavodoxin
MPRTADSIDALLASAVGEAIAKVAPRIAKVIADSAAAQLEARLQVTTSGRRTRAAAAETRSRTRAEITKWVADRNARRVPNFVIELTGGLDTKKKIVARFGEGVVFEKGKPSPKGRVDAAKAGNARKPPNDAAKIAVAK